MAIQGSQVTVKGPKGELFRTLHPDMVIAVKDASLVVTRPSDSQLHRSLHGLTRSLLANMAEGVSKGFTRELELSGVGYRAKKEGDKLVLQLGYSHPVEYAPPPGISLAVAAARISIQGIDKEQVGEVVAQLRSLRPPDAYKGKGIRFIREKLRLKPGKSAASKK